METAEGGMSEGVDYFSLLKTIHKVFGLATLQNLMKDFPGGSYLIIKSTPIVPGGRPIMVIVYR